MGEEILRARGQDADPPPCGRLFRDNPLSEWTTHYLNAVKAIGTDDGERVIAQMKATPVNDFFAKGGVIRPDGRMVHDMYLMQVKTPAESKYPWDYFKL